MTNDALSAPPPRALPRGVTVLLGTAGAAVTVAGIRAFADLLAPIFLALVLTVAVHPVLGRLRRGTPGWLAVALTNLAVIGIVVGLAASLTLSLARLATLLPAYEDRLADVVDQLTEMLAGWGIGREQILAALEHVDFGSLAGLLRDLLSALADAFSSLLFLVFLLFFMGVDAAGFPDRLHAVAETRPAIVSVFAGFARGTRSYLVVSTVFGLIVAVIDAGALWALGIPLPLLWGLLSFITNYVPNIGFVIGLAPPALLGLLEGGPRSMLLVIVVYSVANFVIQSVIQPKYVGDAVNLSLPVTFLSLVFWTAVIGPLGAILAIPLTLLAKALLVDIDPDTRWIGHLLTSGLSTGTMPPEEADRGGAADRSATEERVGSTAADAGR